MKKILFLLFIGIGISASSCKKETIVGPGALTIFTNVQSSQWSLSTTGAFQGYTADVSVPDIDSYYNENGAVLVYLDHGNDGGFELLPNVNGGNSLWYTYKQGHVYLNSQNADGSAPTQNPGALALKIVLVP
ncbi:MAG: hypothetical protein JWR38_3558 [Mucilaginibacter sp.]|nr:hypothetical protein [Mucilaginibacter sp.]